MAKVVSPDSEIKEMERLNVPAGRDVVDLIGATRLWADSERATVVSGLIIDGVIDVRPCSTRFGDYPYCDAIPKWRQYCAASTERYDRLLPAGRATPGASGVSPSSRQVATNLPTVSDSRQDLSRQTTGSSLDL